VRPCVGIIVLTHPNNRSKAKRRCELSRSHFGLHMARKGRSTQSGLAQSTIDFSPSMFPWPMSQPPPQGQWWPGMHASSQTAGAPGPAPQPGLMGWPQPAQYGVGGPFFGAPQAFASPWGMQMQMPYPMAHMQAPPTAAQPPAHQASPHTFVVPERDRSRSPRGGTRGDGARLAFPDDGRKLSTTYKSLGLAWKWGEGRVTPKKF